MGAPGCMLRKSTCLPAWISLSQGSGSTGGQTPSQPEPEAVRPASVSSTSPAHRPVPGDTGAQSTGAGRSKTPAHQSPPADGSSTLTLHPSLESAGHDPGCPGLS